MPGILVTGASTGIGEACALHLDGLGHHVYAGVRKQEDGERLQQRASARLMPVILDVTDASTIDAAVKLIEDNMGTVRFAGVVNNAGVARGGPLEYLPIEEWRDQIEVNVIGQVAVTRAFLPLVRSGWGRVVFIGSIGGRVATPLMGPYTASKFAIEAIADSLRHELEPWDLRVAVVEPGVVKTPIWSKGAQTVERLRADADPLMFERYAPLVDKVVAGIERNAKAGVDPIKVAKAVEHALFASHPKHRYLVGPDAKTAALVARFLPDELRHRVISRFG